MHAASQLPGGGPTDVDDAPASACYIQIPMMMKMNRQIRLFSYKTTG